MVQAPNFGSTRADVMPGNIIIPDGDMARVLLIDLPIAHSTRFDTEETVAAGFAEEPLEPVLDRIAERRPAGPPGAGTSHGMASVRQECVHIRRCADPGIGWACDNQLLGLSYSQRSRILG